jgi:hypothetical protein
MSDTTLAPESSGELATDSWPEGSPESWEPIHDTIAVVYAPRTRAPLLACIAKRTYTFSATGKVSVADFQIPLTIDPVISDCAQDSLAKLEDDTDLLAPKEATDIIFRGTAHSPKKTKELYVAVALGNVARRLRVIGERRVEVAPDGAVKFSPAEPFERLAITPEAAYGGYDEFAQDRLDPPRMENIYLLGHKPVGIFAYPRNSAGTAYFIDVERQRASGVRLPQVEDPSDSLVPERFFVPVPLAWMDAPVPALTGWLPHATYPRFVRYFGDRLPHLPPTRKIREMDLGCGADLADLAKLGQGEIHPRALQGASPGFAVERLRGDELGILQNLTPEAEELRFSLPGEAPRFSLSIPDVRKAFSPRPVLQTVRIDADQKRLSLTWCATLPLLSRAMQSFLDQCDLTVDWGRL